MPKFYRKPRVRVGASSCRPPGVPGEVGLSAAEIGRHGPRPLQRRAQKRKKVYTPAERELERILNALNGGVLKGKFHREWAFSRWIVDFLFWENRLAIEVDGPYHQSARQRAKDAAKTADLEGAGITVLRLTNQDIFGDRELLIEKLRAAYRKANQRP